MTHCTKIVGSAGLDLESMDILAREFIERRSISVDIELNPPLLKAIVFLERSDKLVRELSMNHIERLDDEVSWPSMFDMYERNYEYCAGALSLFILAQLPSCEALCRTAIEGAVNLEYVSIGDSMGKQIAYFKSYISTERNQNKTWREAVAKSSVSDQDKAFHYNKIDDKEGALNQYEYMLKESLSLAGVNYVESDEKWPNIFERFRDTRKEVEYRTLYTALCSQAHNDAEDVLNSIMARVTANVEGMQEAHQVEQYLYSLFYTLSAIRYHICSSAMFLAKFEIKISMLMELYDQVMTELEWIADNLEDVVRSHLIFK